jgi:hypothetical protein
MQSDFRSRMDDYVRKQSTSVSGWLSRESAEVICHLAVSQVESGLRGGVGEIGIHHGKLFLLLYLSLQDGERAFALDVFEEQQLNVDASGLGDRAIFLRNLAKVGGIESRVSIFATDSCSVTADSLLSASGELRMMSIDGGHTEDITHNDMCLAEELLQNDGILILDDAFNERWPAVAAGAYRFLLEPGRSLRPFAISPNKTYFCKSPDAAARYRSTLSTAFAEIRSGEATVLGSDVLILGRRSIVNRIRNTPIVRDNPELYRRLSKLRQRLR